MSTVMGLRAIALRQSPQDSQSVARDKSVVQTNVFFNGDFILFYAEPLTAHL
ncbi:hypothetical protein [Halomicronema sp. CCY15110]|uniref:hypothetical protein n=1 Tax=Halomicronema sp. CCY15110 TaxID=2767773 RepID=UPI001950C915|nr:hypothetical protein [Halomicronema sp. CCY15110]